MAQVVYTGSSTTAVGGGLFEGKKFWLAQKLPTRSRFVDLVKVNGGEIVPLEQHADIKIADPLFKKTLPPDSYSYTFIEQSIRHGELQDLEEHRAGPETITSRPVGSRKPARGTRLTYSAEDDRFLYDWVTSHERSGGKILGNLIYQQLEQINPRHPWQSWRDRWVKQLSQRPAPPQHPANPPTPPADRSPDQTTAKRMRVKGHSPENTIKLEGEKAASESASSGASPSKELNTRKQQKQAKSPSSRRVTALEGPKGLTSAAPTEGELPQEPSSTPTATKTMTTDLAGVKRKRVDMDEDATVTVRPAPRAAKRAKPQRKRGDDGREIPSTPELGPSSPPQTASSQGPALRETTEDQDQDSESENFLQLEQVISRSLTDRDPNEQTTQALLDDPTQRIDFELAEPEGGWDKILPDEATTLPGEDEVPPQPPQLQDTQALLQGPTQALDFELAEPEGGWDDILPEHTLPQLAPTSASQPPPRDTVDTEKQLGAWIDAHVAAGASEDDVLLALKCSSMHTGLAELVLNSLAGDEGVPEDVRGIWTEREDEALRGGDGRAIKMLEEKHGKEAFRTRWNFLTTYDQLGDA
ncbi:hypothetical protein FGG08_000688 [Glutinoglossum americanum]|uniref:DNA-binding protein RAP1 n=1 Tax=Glutinoglossum americanum TaxID=1670608 RepID=A0A9P8L5X8_9PEZI|nr:hypothetical protein FGG08_000688 [Glutinoglossum americanum]